MIIWLAAFYPRAGYIRSLQLNINFPYRIPATPQSERSEKFAGRQRSEELVS